MPIASNVVNYLIEQGVDFSVLHHTHSSTSMETAERAHVSSDEIAKSVLLEDDQGYLLAVLPANCRVGLDALQRLTHRSLVLATEYELGTLFEDCEIGAIPPLGPVYGMDMIIDDALMEQSNIYFEAGDHEKLICVSGETFDFLVGGAEYSRFGRHCSPATQPLLMQ